MTLTSSDVADFALRSTPSNLAVNAAKALLVTSTWRAARGAGSDTVARLLSTVVARGERQAVAALGAEASLSAPSAAMVSAVAMDAGGGDDDITRAVHAVVAAAVAGAQCAGATGPALVNAVVVGTEAVTRVTGVLGPHLRRRGWDPAGTTGPLGATAAVGRLLGLDVPTLSQALGIAATQSAGLAVAAGSMATSLSTGRAAANGLEAALLSAAGFTGPPAGLEGRRGFAGVAVPEASLHGAGDGLGEQWWLDQRAVATGEAPETINAITGDVAAGRRPLQALIEVSRKESATFLA